MPQWFRLYAEFAFDPKIQVLTEALQRRYVMMLCLQCNGMFEGRPHDEVALSMRISLEEWEHTRSEFLKRGLLTEEGVINGWEKRQFISDLKDPTASQRQRSYRDRQRDTRNGTVTSRPPDQTRTRADTEPDQRGSGGGILKNGLGGFGLVLDLETADKLLQVAPGWDQHFLMGKYSEWQNGHESPRNPQAAFIGWARKFTKGRRPNA